MYIDTMRSINNIKYVYSTGKGIIRFNYKSKTLFIKDLYDCHIDLNFIRQNAGEIDKLVLYKVEKNAQFYNISKENLPFIKECYYLSSFFCKQCTRGIFKFNTVYTTEAAIRSFYYKIGVNNFNDRMLNRYFNPNNELEYNTFGRINEISKEDNEKYLKLLEDIKLHTSSTSLVEYQLEDKLE